MPSNNPGVVVTPTPYTPPTLNVHTTISMVEDTLIDLHNSNISFLDVKAASSNFFIKFDKDNFSAFNTKFFITQVTTDVETTVNLQYSFAGEVVATKSLTVEPLKTTTLTITAVVKPDQSVTLVLLGQTVCDKPLEIVNDAGVLTVNATYLNSILEYNSGLITFNNIGPTSGWLASVPAPSQTSINITLPEAYTNDLYELFIWMSTTPLGGYSDQPQPAAPTALRFTHSPGSSTIDSYFESNINGTVSGSLALNSTITVRNYYNNQLNYNSDYGPNLNLSGTVYIHMLMVGDNVQSLPFSIIEAPLEL